MPHRQSPHGNDVLHAARNQSLLCRWELELDTGLTVLMPPHLPLHRHRFALDSVLQLEADGFPFLPHSSAGVREPRRQRYSPPAPLPLCRRRISTSTESPAPPLVGEGAGRFRKSPRFAFRCLMACSTAACARSRCRLESNPTGIPEPPRHSSLKLQRLRNTRQLQPNAHAQARFPNGRHIPHAHPVRGEIRCH